MKKPAIKGSSSTEDMFQFHLVNDSDIFEILADIFDLYGRWDDFELDGNTLYEHLMRRGYSVSSLRLENSFVYLFFTPSTIHLLIRRTGNFEKLIKKLLDHFEYVKYELKDYMDTLSQKEKKILLRIREELAALNQETFIEFPDLTPKEIKAGIKKLERVGMVKLEDEMWTTTEKGDSFVNTHQKEFKKIYKEFLEQL